MRFIILFIFLIASHGSIADASQQRRFHKWTVGCNTDRISDNTVCSMTQDVEVATALKETFITFSIFRNIKSDQLQLKVFSTSLKPREPVFIRIDQNLARQPQNYSRDYDSVIFPNSESTISEISTGKRMFVRFTDKYSNLEYDLEFDLSGFNIALSQLMFMKE